ncbi:MAG: hypothetical protein IT233_00110 [Bacteroidia bacterium]|nr:hypothetical protein [Bacteroidia bacterium]
MRILFTLILFLFVGGLWAEDQVVHDALEGTTIHYRQKYVSLDKGISYGTKDLDVAYPVLLSLKDSSIQKKLNKRLMLITLGQAGSDSLKLKLYKDHDEKIRTYFTIYNKVQDQLGGDAREITAFVPTLTEVDFAMVSYFHGILTVVISFEYRTRYEEYLDNAEFCYDEVYYFDLHTGTEHRPGSVFLPSAQTALTKLIEDKVRTAAAGLSIELDEEDSDFYLDAMKDASGRELSLVKFSFTRDGFLYPKAFSFAYYISAFKACMLNIYGLSTSVRIEFGELKSFLNPNGPFGFLETYIFPSGNPKKVFVSPDQPYPDYTRQIPKVMFTENIPYQLSLPIKKVTVFRTDKTSNAEKTVKEREYEYLKNGLLKSLVHFDQDDQIYSSLIYTYDSQSRLIKESRYQKKKLESTKDYGWHPTGNLIYMLETDNDESPTGTWYFYGKDFILTERHEFFAAPPRDGRFTKCMLNPKGQVISIIHQDAHRKTDYGPTDIMYTKAGKISASIMRSRPTLHSTLYVYDDGGNLLSYEYDNGRYLNEYTWDENSRLTMIRGYDSKRQIMEQRITWNKNGLPEKTEIPKQGSNYPRSWEFKYEFWE